MVRFHKSLLGIARIVIPTAVYAVLAVAPSSSNAGDEQGSATLRFPNKTIVVKMPPGWELKTHTMENNPGAEKLGSDELSGDYTIVKKDIGSVRMELHQRTNNINYLIKNLALSLGHNGAHSERDVLRRSGVKYKYFYYRFVKEDDDIIRVAAVVNLKSHCLLIMAVSIDEDSISDVFTIIGSVTVDKNADR